MRLHARNGEPRASLSNAARETVMLRIQVKADLCCGVGLCVKGDCAKVYQRDELGYNCSDGQMVPAGLEELARKGAAACPETAIALIEVD